MLAPTVGRNRARFRRGGSRTAPTRFPCSTTPGPLLNQEGNKSDN
jgi:hypothetical protein